MDEGEGPEAKTEGRRFRGDVVMGVWRNEGGWVRWIVVADIADGSDGGRSAGVGGGCEALMEKGLGEAVGIDLDDAGDGQGDGGRR